MKKLFAALATLGGSFAALAEGEATVTIPTAVKLDGIQSAVSTWADAAIPVLLSIAGVFLGFYLLKFGIRAMKSIAGASK